MGTKWKNYRYSIWLKLVAILLCIVGMLSFASGLTKASNFEYAIQNTEYKESAYGTHAFREAFSNIFIIAFKLKSEAYINSGATIDKDDIANQKNQLEEQKVSEIRDIGYQYEGLLDEAKSYGNNDEYDKLILEKKGKINKITEEYTSRIENIEKSMIASQISDLKQQTEKLKNLTGISYTAFESSKNIFSNVESKLASDVASAQSFYEKLPYFVKINRNNIENFYNPLYSTYNYYESQTNGIQYTANNIPDNATIYIGMSPWRFEQERLEFEKKSQDGLLGIQLSVIGLVLFLIGLIYLMYATGRRSDEEGIHLNIIDKVYLDIGLVVANLLIFLCISGVVVPLSELRFSNYYNVKLMIVSSIFLIAVGTLILIAIVTMIVKRIKRHEFFSHTFIYKLCSWVIRKIKSLWDKFFGNMNGVLTNSPISIRLTFLFAAYAFVILICVLLFLAGPLGILVGLASLIGVNVAVCYFVLKVFKSLTDIKEGANRIRSGELTYNIPTQKVPELKELSDVINQIADGLKGAVGSQVRAERMKAELITNVSHDLKTPLTSIITYVDLLKKEGLQSENADKYLGIIDTKSQRLKSLTEDLFEAAKASSGNIPVNLEKLDVVSLITQGLGELSDKIESSSLIFKTNLPSEKLYVLADGKLLWRTIENLLSNVFKYALPSSRVYIDAIRQYDKVTITVKNISAYELNINADELMERFKRGDESRSSEGSGLGLSIAKSLTELQGGTFSLNIDGDLFKATIVLPAHEV